MAGDHETLRPLLPIVADELNVKEVVFAESVETFGRWRAKPNFKTLGPRLGPRVKDVARALARDDGTEAAALAADLSVTLMLDDGEPVVLAPDDVDLAQEVREGWGVASEGGVTVALDLEVSAELRREGLARELVRVIQDARKAAGLDVTDRISLGVETSGEVAAALAEHATVVAGETLATNLASTLEPRRAPSGRGGRRDVGLAEPAAGLALSPSPQKRSRSDRSPWGSGSSSCPARETAAGAGSSTRDRFLGLRRLRDPSRWWSPVLRAGRPPAAVDFRGLRRGWFSRFAGGRRGLRHPLDRLGVALDQGGQSLQELPLPREERRDGGPIGLASVADPAAAAATADLVLRLLDDARGLCPGSLDDLIGLTGGVLRIRGSDVSAGRIAPERSRSFSSVSFVIEAVSSSRNSSTSRIRYPPNRDTANSFAWMSSAVTGFTAGMPLKSCASSVGSFFILIDPPPSLWLSTARSAARR